MKVYQTSEIRNLSLIGNKGSGKTTLAEAMLFDGGVISRRGDVGSKNTASDYRDIEHEQACSIYTSILYTEWNGHKLNILDTPGADDFVGGVVSSLHVTDVALMLVNAQNGVEVGTEITWRHTKKMEKPVVFVVNYLDHEKVNFEKTVDELKEYFGNKVVLAQYPVNAGPEFNAIIDVIAMKMYKWTGDSGKAQVLDIPANEKEKADELLNTLIEAAAENDESLMEKFFENGTLTEAEMQEGMKKGIATRSIFPVFCTASKRNMGVDRLMDFIVASIPSPDQMPAPKDTNGHEIACSSKIPASLYFFKNSVEQHLGEILFFKLMSGELEEGADLVNLNKTSKERVSQLFSVVGKNRTKVTKFVAGDIGATVKLKDTKVHHTLGVKGADHVFPVIQYPNPKYRIAIRAKNEADDEKLGEILHRMHDEDPTLILEYSKELKQLILHGQGEHHLNILKWQMDNIFKIDIEFIAPKIPYRETITKIAAASYRHRKQSGGAGQFGEVYLVIEPHEDGKPDPTKYKIGDKDVNISVRGKEEFVMPWGGKLVYYNCIVGGVIEARFLPAILKGIMEKMEEGPLTGSYARDIRVAVYDGKMHPVDSNEISFKLAGMNAFKQAFREAGPKIMEPIYNVEVLVPSDRMGDVMSDLQGRRAVIQGMSSEQGYERLKIKVPIAEMGKYSTILSSLTNGRATFTMEFAEYAQVPGDLQEKLLKAYDAEQDDE